MIPLPQAIRRIQNFLSTLLNRKSLTDSRTGEGLVCTDADREELNKFRDEIKKYQDKLDDPNFVFEEVIEHSVVAAWRKALVACTYSLESVPALVADLNSDDENTRTVASDVLREMIFLATPAVIAALIAAFRDNDRNMRDRARDFLAEEINLNSNTLPALAEALEDNDVNVRILASSAINDMLNRTSRVEGISILIRPLIVALKDKDEKIRSLAADILWKIGDESIPALTEASNSEDEIISQRAVEILRRIDQELHTIRLPSKVNFWINSVWQHFANQGG